MANVQLVKQRQYRMNLNYALKVKEYLDKLLDVGFIYPIETTQWLSLLAIIPNKNGKLHTCVDYKKLNVQIQKDHVVGYEMFFYGWL